MRIAELRTLKVDELETKLLDLRKEQFVLRMRRSQGTLDKFHQFKPIRKTIARIKTVLKEKEGIYGK